MNLHVHLIAQLRQGFLTLVQGHMGWSQHHRVHEKEADAAHGGLHHVGFQGFDVDSLFGQMLGHAVEDAFMIGAA